ncbi:hypothetical protein O7599_14375 [Streptomyces sp. WMMC500]|uniref:hypothetical protein n=1 Tax=Streptomyces sp. WMMC500 TaxID=3015154 RepID=UPI00248D332F|nr:hypothetical protein [Streptomyces sp. WMMC500]WBB63630.1 hypothetical protein O7599_14375 [Streptomyces sp. WMMC500]
MAGSFEAVTARVQAAAARTSAAGSARLSYGLHFGAPTLEERDQLGEGVVDFAARVAQVSRFFLPGHVRDGLQNVPEAFTRPHEMLYDGATELMRSGDSWLAFTDGDRDGSRGHQDPLWPLDALFGASDDIIEAGTDTIRDADTTHYRLTVDLVAADELLPTGIGVPEGPLRRLRELPAEVWLDDAGLARRIAIQNAVGNRQIWTFTEFWDFGVAVAITSPDPDQITTADPADFQRIFMGDS